MPHRVLRMPHLQVVLGARQSEDWGPALPGLMRPHGHPPTPHSTPTGGALPRTGDIPSISRVPSVLPRAQHGAQDIHVVEETRSLGGAGDRVCRTP